MDSLRHTDASKRTKRQRFALVEIGFESIVLILFPSSEISCFSVPRSQNFYDRPFSFFSNGRF